MKKLIGLIFSVLVFIVGAALIVPFLIPLESYKNEATARLSSMTGRPITIDGDIRLKFLPNISISLEDVTIGNPKGFKTPYLAKIKALDMEVALQPLFHKKVDIHRLNLQQPDVQLETLRDGRINWHIDFSSAAAGRGDAPAAGYAAIFALSLIADAVAAEQSVKKTFALSSVNLAGFSVHDGKLTYQDAAGNPPQRLDSINLTADAVAVDKPLAMDGSVVWNDEKVNVTAKAASLADVLAAKPSHVSLTADSKHVKVIYSGKASPAGIQGDIELGSPSLREMSGWLGSKPAWNKSSLTFAVKGGITCSTVKCTLSKANIALDAMRLFGDVTMTLGGKPNISGSLSTDVLDLSPYMNKPRAAWFSPLIGDAMAAGGRWDTTHIDLSGLQAVNADMDIRAGSVIAPPWQLADVKLNVNIQQGNAGVTIDRASAFGGTIHGVISAKTQNRSLHASCNLKASGVQIEPLLRTLSDNDRLSGTATLNIVANAAGSSVQSLIETLSGNGNIMIRDGAIKGINLAEMARNVKSAFTGQNPGVQKTDFAELGGSFSIKNGVISNPDLAMKAPFIRMQGAGSIKLPAYRINYRLVPELVETSKGQDGKDKTGIAVPILVTGALDNPHFAPDVQSIIQDAIQNPEKFQENIDAVKEQIKGGKGDFKDMKNEMKDAFKDPKKLLEDPEQMNKVNDLLQQFR